MWNRSITWNLPFQAVSLLPLSPIHSLLLRLLGKRNSIRQQQKSIEGSNRVKLSEFLEFIPAVRTEDVKTHSPPETPKRLTILYSWLMAKPQHLAKYIDVFTSHGIDVLKVRVTPLDVFRPVSRTQVCAKEVCDFLLSHPQYQKILVVGFSVGAYQFSESVKMIRDMPDIYGSIPSRFVGHMWDSPVDLPGASEGISKSVTNNLLLQKWIKTYVDWLLKVRYDSWTIHFADASAHFHESPMDNAPCLYLYSKADTISVTWCNDQVIEDWVRRGKKVTKKVFETGVHCALFSQHKLEYKKLFDNFLVETTMVRGEDVERG